MEDQIRIVGRLQSKSGVLSKPQFFTDVPLVILHVRKEYLSGLMNWSKAHNMNDLEIVIQERPKDITQRGKNFFFALRDRIAKASGDKSKEHKEHLYRSCIREYASSAGLKKESIKDLDKRELWLCTEIMYEWCIEAEAYIADLIPEYQSVQKELKE